MSVAHDRILISLLLALGACGGSSVPRASTQPQPTAADPVESTTDVAELEQLCLAGRLDACDKGGAMIADWLETGDGDNKKARDFFWFACQRDDAEGCDQLALLERDPVQRGALQEKACRLGAGRSCTSLGLAALDAERFDEAVRYLQQACDAGDPDGMACGLAADFRNR